MVCKLKLLIESLYKALNKVYEIEQKNISREYDSDYQHFHTIKHI